MTNYSTQDQRPFQHTDLRIHVSPSVPNKFTQSEQSLLYTKNTNSLALLHFV